MRHKTAGIQYLAQFRLGDAVPQTKAYLPVRHYASNDLHVMEVLQDWIQKHEEYTTRSGTCSYTDVMLKIL